MIGTLTIPEIEHVLKTQLIGRIGCCDAETVYVVPTSYAYENGNVYAHAKEGKKLDMMRKNPNVCFEVDQIEQMSNWKTVIAWGEFREMKTVEDRNQVLQILLRRNHSHLPSETVQLTSSWPFGKDYLSGIEGTAYLIKLTKITGRFEKDEQSPRLAG